MKCITNFDQFEEGDNLEALGVDEADHGGRAVLGMNCLRSLGRWDRGFESHSRHGCMCVFILCLCCSVCS
jgi:hypothetical protein